MAPEDSKKAYLFVYTDNVGTRKELVKILNEMEHVITWRYDMPNVFYIVSTASAYKISKEFEEKNAARSRFIFMECTENCQGRLTEETWYLLANKETKE